ncbi:hypothetical protein FKP32DRAFT_1587529 [Trametes sanguinea]|nr:hypothetical protein FKP32DRAFT_1587529 [Trametes sanguinea]
MLAVSRVSRSTAATRHATRSLATEAQAGSQKAQRPFRKWNPKGPEVEAQPNTIYVRAWDEIDSMPAFYALVRGLEKRFGRIREFRVTRDFDVPTSYGNFFLAEFADPDAIDRVPVKGTHVKVEVPVVPKHRPGGVGLDQLQGLLQAEDFDPELVTDDLNKPVIKPMQTAEGDDSKPTRVVELIVERSKGYKVDPREAFRARHAGPFGIAFYQWGGFYRPSSADEPPVPKEMQEVLAKWQRKAEKSTRAAESASAPAPDSSRDYEAADMDDSRAPELAEHAPEEQEIQASQSGSEQSREVDMAATSSVSNELPSSSETVESTAADTSSSTPPTPEAPSPSSTVSPGSEPSEATTKPPAEEQPERPKRLSQREKILMLARMHAKTPLQDAKTEAEKKIEEEQARAQAADAAKEEQKATMGSLRDRLLRMLGKSS